MRVGDLVNGLLPNMLEEAAAAAVLTSKAGDDDCRKVCGG